VRFRLADAWHLETELLTSITEVGFSVGTGGALLIGDPYGSKLSLGFETIGIEKSTYFGRRFYTKMDILATCRLILSPMIEVTDMPHAEAFGVRLLGEADMDLGRGFMLGLRGGYQARKSTSGGPSVGGNLALAFLPCLRLPSASRETTSTTRFSASPLTPRRASSPSPRRPPAPRAAAAGAAPPP